MGDAESVWFLDAENIPARAIHSEQYEEHSFLVVK